MARTYYRNNPRRLRFITDFERTYRPKDALRWCFRNPFPSHLLQRAFMSQDLINSLYVCFSFVMPHVSYSSNLNRVDIFSSIVVWKCPSKLSISSKGILVSSCVQVVSLLATNREHSHWTWLHLLDIGLIYYPFCSKSNATTQSKLLKRLFKTVLRCLSSILVQHFASYASIVTR